MCVRGIIEAAFSDAGDLNILKEATIYIFSLCCSIGLLKLKEWERKAAVFIEILCAMVSALLVITGVFVAGNVNWLIIVRIFLEIAIVIFLTRPKVKALFSPERGEAESKEAV